MSKRWRRTASVGGAPTSTLPPANVVAVNKSGDFSVTWVFDASLDASPSPWTNLDGFLVNGEQTVSANKIDDFSIDMAYPSMINSGDPWHLIATPPTHVIFDPAADLQSSAGDVT